MRFNVQSAAIVLAFTGAAVASLNHGHAAAHEHLHKRNANPQVVQEGSAGNVYVPAANTDWQAAYAASVRTASSQPWQSAFAATYGKAAAAATTVVGPTTTTKPQTTLQTHATKAKHVNTYPKNQKKKKPANKAAPSYGNQAPSYSSSGTTTTQAPVYGSGTNTTNKAGTTQAPVYGGGSGGKTGKAPDGGSGAITVNIENRMGRPLSMLYVSNSGAPCALGDPASRTTLGTSEPTAVTFPQNWAGQITLGDDYQSCGSKLEGSNTPPEIGFIDVSYVDGYSVPIVCSCGDKPDTPVSGCNVELDIEANCPAENKVGKACTNPSITNQWGPTPAFFKKCEAAAYTFSKDDAATCGCPNSRVFDCCVGTACPSRSAATLKGGTCQGSL